MEVPYNIQLNSVTKTLDVSWDFLASLLAHHPNILNGKTLQWNSDRKIINEIANNGIQTAIWLLYNSVFPTSNHPACKQSHTALYLIGTDDDVCISWHSSISGQTPHQPTIKVTPAGRSTNLRSSRHRTIIWKVRRSSMAIYHDQNTHTQSVLFSFFKVTPR